ncbi:MAG: helix-turn-helix domain-containing protein, partial [Eubacteriales bacterium]|nr:helix-turn-helix domain-containing protein [Eubacteriales bacterium]
EQLADVLGVSRQAISKWEKNIDVVMKKTLENDKHIKFPQILIGVLTLIAVIIVFCFGGSIIETIFSIGRTLGNAIGDLFWK